MHFTAQDPLEYRLKLFGVPITGAITTGMITMIIGMITTGMITMIIGMITYLLRG